MHEGEDDEKYDEKSLWRSLNMEIKIHLNINLLICSSTISGLDLEKKKKKIFKKK